MSISTTFVNNSVEKQAAEQPNGLKGTHFSWNAQTLCRTDRAEA